MTGLADSIERAGRHSGRPCGVATLRDHLAGDVLNDLDAMLTNKTVSASAIHTGLVDYMAGENVDIPGRQTIEKHRRGDCRCGGKA